MILDINPYLAIVIVFFSSIACLILFAFFIEWTRKYLEKKNNKTDSPTDFINRKSKIYQIIYENNGLTLELISRYFDSNEEKMKKELDIMINEGTLLFEDNKYIINKNNNQN